MSQLLKSVLNSIQGKCLVRYTLIFFAIVALNGSTVLAQISMEQLEKFPKVKQVDAAGEKNAPCQVIHLLNYHFVSRELFAADLEDRLQKRLSRIELNKEYRNFLDRVEEVQEDQIIVLRQLISDQGVKEVYYEGVTQENLNSFLSRVKRLKEFQPPVVASASPFDLLIREQYEQDLLEIGASGKLLMTGELKSVLPLDDKELLEAANPIREVDHVLTYEKANQKREDFMARQVLSGSSPVVIVLGAGHDLTNNLAWQTESFRYLRVRIEHLPKSSDSFNSN